MTINEALEFCAAYGVTIEFSNLNTKWAKNRSVQIYLEPADRDPAITIVWTSFTGDYVLRAHGSDLVKAASSLTQMLEHIPDKEKLC